MALPDRPAERHRQVVAGFTARVDGTRDWEAPSPVADWTARDVVRHLTQWFPAFLSAGTGIQLGTTVAVDDDPAAAWHAQCHAVQSLLDDPATAGRTLDDPHVGSLPLELAVDRFYTADVFMHTWDLARATGQDDRLDPDFCAQLLAGMEQAEEAIRASGHYGVRVPVPADADPQTALLGFIGRDPWWKPPAGTLGP